MLDGPHEVDDPLLAGDAADEQDVRHRRIDAMGLEGVGRRVGVVEVGVDPVVDDVDARRVDAEVAEDVLARALADRDDRIGQLHRRALDPAAHVVAAAELLALPRPQRLERVDGEHERDAVRQPGEDAGQVGVPGVDVDDVRIDRVRHHRHVPRQGGEHGAQALDRRRPGRGRPRRRGRASRGSSAVALPNVRMSSSTSSRRWRVSSSTWTPAPP